MGHLLADLPTREPEIGVVGMFCGLGEVPTDGDTAVFSVNGDVSWCIEDAILKCITVEKRSMPIYVNDLMTELRDIKTSKCGLPVNVIEESDKGTGSMQNSRLKRWVITRVYLPIR